MPHRNGAGPKSTLRCHLDDALLSDFTLHFGGKTVRAHKIILAAASGFFEKMFRSHFQESNASTMTVEDDDPKLFHSMLKYIYGYQGDIKNGTLIVNVDLYLLADKYDVPSLKQAIEHNVSSRRCPSKEEETDHFTALMRAHDGPAHIYVPLGASLFSPLRSQVPRLLVDRDGMLQKLLSERPQAAIHVTDFFKDSGFKHFSLQRIRCTCGTDDFFHEDDGLDSCNECINSLDSGDVTCDSVFAFADS